MFFKSQISSFKFQPRCCNWNFLLANSLELEIKISSMTFDCLFLKLKFET